MPHVNATTWAGVRADALAAATHLRDARGVTRLFDVGFCFGGRAAADLGILPELGLTGAIPFYGWPVGPGRNDLPAPAEVAGRLRCPVLAIFGGADQGIPPEAVDTYRAALATAGPQHRVISYPGAPHSFFDRKQEEFAAQSAAAWGEVLAFVRGS
jgi:carboxymethylenebutenolidase